jgi:hypothetical protein
LKEIRTRKKATNKERKKEEGEDSKPQNMSACTA